MERIASFNEQIIKVPNNPLNYICVSYMLLELSIILFIPCH